MAAMTAILDFRTILTTFYLQVTLILPTKFRVNWPFGSGEEDRKIFSRWQPWRSSWVLDRNDFSYFWSISHPNGQNQVSSQSVQWFRRRKMWKAKERMDWRQTGRADRKSNSNTRRGDTCNSKSKKAKVVILVGDTSSHPVLHFFQES